MASNVLITGAAGYIGGSIVADLLNGSIPVIGKDRINTAVRSEEQANALSKLGINVLRLDLSDEDAVIDNVLRLKIGIIIHTSSSIDPKLAIPLITALGKQKEISGGEVHFIHTSALSAFFPNTSWPVEKIADTNNIFELEKRLADSYPVRKTDVEVIERAEVKGVTSFIVVPSIVYGEGTGEWNKLSVVLPIYVKASITHKSVHKFAENTKISGVRVSDLTAIYSLILEKILKKDAIPSGTEGYYFALAHDLHMWDVLDRLASALKARGLIEDSTTAIWENGSAAAETLGVPEQFVTPLWNSGDNLIATNAFKIGWKPTWDTKKFLDNIDDEVQSVLRLEKAKSSLIDTLFQFSKA